MKQFMDENFLLQSETAQKLYHSYAADAPIALPRTSANFKNFSLSEASPVMYFSSTPQERIKRHL